MFEGHAGVASVARYLGLEVCWVYVGWWALRAGKLSPRIYQHRRRRPELRQAITRQIKKITKILKQVMMAPAEPAMHAMLHAHFGKK